MAAVRIRKKLQDRSFYLETKSDYCHRSFDSQLENIEVTRTAKILTVVGARPNFMKAAPIIAAIRSHNDRLTVSPRLEGMAEPQIVLETTTRQCQTDFLPI
jgi:hypothetical protein